MIHDEMEVYVRLAREQRIISLCSDHRFIVSVTQKN